MRVLQRSMSPLRGVLTVPGDKSISHRSVLFGAIAEGTTTVRGFLRSADCLATIDCFRKMGIEIEEITGRDNAGPIVSTGGGAVFRDGGRAAAFTGSGGAAAFTGNGGAAAFTGSGGAAAFTGNGGSAAFTGSGRDHASHETILRIHGKGLYGLKAPQAALNAMNSGTTARLLSGILAGQAFASTIIGDASLSRRPMRRILIPLTEMGAHITATDGHLPMTIRGGKLRGISYESPVASAQVKSCITLAGLYAEGTTRVTEPALSRNHTELMLAAFGADIRTECGQAPTCGTNPRTEHGSAPTCGTNPQTEHGSAPTCGTNPRTERDPAPTCVVRPGQRLSGIDITVPGDISSAAFFLAAANLVPGSELLLTNVGTNPTRCGILSVLLAMGGDIVQENIRLAGGEPVADLLVRFAPLHGTTIGGSLIPTLIDELPVIAVLAAFAEGDTVIRDAGELRVKESDRLSLMVENLRSLGIQVEEYPDGMVIHGNSGRPFRSAAIDPHGDHRLAMAFAIAGLASPGGITILDEACVAVSYPDFFQDLARVGVRL